MSNMGKTNLKSGDTLFERLHDLMITIMWISIFAIFVGIFCIGLFIAFPVYGFLFYIGITSLLGGFILFIISGFLAEFFIAF